MKHNIIISSDNKMSGTNNNANYFIDFSSFLIENATYYKVKYKFSSSIGYFEYDENNEYSIIILQVDFQNKSLTYDSYTKSSSNTLGFVPFNFDHNIFSNLSETQNTTFIKTPLNNTVINIKLINGSIQNGLSNQLILQNNGAGVKTEFPKYNLILELEAFFD